MTTHNIPNEQQAHQIMREATPAFMAAMETVVQLSGLHGHEHPLVATALMLAQEVAPPSFKAMMQAQAQAMGLIPDADGYLDDGTPVYRLEDIAQRVGLSPQDAQTQFEAMQRERDALGLDTLRVDPATVNRKH